MRGWDANTLAVSLRETGWMLGIEVTMLVLVGWIAAKLFRSNHMRRAVWCGIILAIGTIAIAELTGAVRAVPLLWTPEGIPTALSQANDAPVLAPAIPASPTVLRAPPTTAAPPNSVPLNWTSFMGLFWLGGTVLLVSILLGAHALLWRLRRRLQPMTEEITIRHLARQLRASDKIHVGTCPAVQSPFVFGLWQPTMVLPAQYPDELNAAHRDAIVVHELAHLVHRDPWWQLLADAMVALLWWHPGSWIARTMFRRAAEHAADEATTILPDGPVLLAESLVALGRRQLRYSWCAGLAVHGRPSTWLSQRVLALLEMTPPRPQRIPRWRWLRPLLLAALIITVMVGAAAARSNTFAEGTNMRLSKSWRTSLVALAVLATVPDPAPAQVIMAPVGKAGKSGLVSVGAAGKSEEAAMDAINLNDEQRRQFRAAKDASREATNKIMIMKSSSDRVAEGKVINTQWREELRKIMTAEQYSRYVEYWQTNKVVMKRSEPDAHGKTSYTVSISAHPLDTDGKLAANLKLSADQSDILDRLKKSLANELAGIHELAQSPAKLPDVAKQLASLQRRRNEALQEILSEGQYVQYRTALDAIVESDLAASRQFHGSLRMSKPEKK